MLPGTPHLPLASSSPISYHKAFMLNYPLSKLRGNRFMQLHRRQHQSGAGSHSMDRWKTYRPPILPPLRYIVHGICPRRRCSVHGRRMRLSYPMLLSSSNLRSSRIRRALPAPHRPNLPSYLLCPTGNHPRSIATSESILLHLARLKQRIHVCSQARCHPHLTPPHGCRETLSGLNTP